MSETPYLTVQQAADRLSLRKVESVLRLIHSGSLRASDVSATGSKRPTWRIDPADLNQFLASRAAKAPEPVTPRRRARRQAHVIEFF